MDIEKEQVEWGQNLIRQFMEKDRGNLKYLNIAVAFIWFLTYLWGMDELDSHAIVFPLVLIACIITIGYLTWYWKKGPGGKYLDSLDTMKRSGIAAPKTGQYWENLDKEFAAALTKSRWEEAYSLSDIILSHRRELELSTVSLLLDSAESARPLILFRLGRYQEAKTAYESRITEKTAKGLFVSDIDRDILEQCIAKLGLESQSEVPTNLPHPPIPSQHIPSTISIQQSPPLYPSEQPVPVAAPAPPLAKICPYCQSSNSATSNQCRLCLSTI